jgi:chromosome segregation ATPase
MMAVKSDISDYMQIIWKRKWLIVIPTLFCMIVTGAVSFLLPVKWEIDCIITPGKFLTQTSNGTFQEFKVADPKQITELINQGTYTTAVIDQLQLEREHFPKLEAKHLKNTDLILISLKEGDIQKGKSLLAHTFNLLKKDIDTNIHAEINNLEIQISSLKTQIERQEINIKNKKNDIMQKKNEIKLNRINIRLKDSQKQEKLQKINSMTNLSNISQERAKNILTEMSEVKQRITQIENQQKTVMASDKENALSLLLYSNEIQENLRYYNNLGGEFNQEKIKQEELSLKSLNAEEELKVLDMEKEIINTNIESLNTEILSIENSIEQIRRDIEETQNNIALLKERKTRIQYTQLTKEPTSSIYPVSPKKRLNVLIAAILSLALFTLVAFFMEYVPGASLEKSRE